MRSCSLPCAAAAVALLLSASESTAQPPAAKADDELRFHSLPIGAGSCHIVECPGTPAATAPLIYDCGSRALGPALAMSQAEVEAYFTAVLAPYPDPIVVISHPDSDHFRFIPALVTAGDAQTVWYGGNRGGYPSRLRNWFDANEAAGVNVRGGANELPDDFHNNGDAVPELACGDAETFVLTVNAGGRKNSRSLLLRIEYDDFSLTLTGDATDATQDSAIANFPGGLATTVLTSSHHGAETHGSNEPTWANATQPEVVIHSAGVRFFHPLCTSVANFHSHLTTTQPHQFWCGDRAGKSKYYRVPRRTSRAEYSTAVSGAIWITTDGTGTSIECDLTPGCGF